MKTAILILVSVLWAPFTTHSQVGAPLPPKIAGCVSNVLKQIGYDSRSFDPQARSRIFNASMAELEQAVDEKTAAAAMLAEGNTIEAKLVTIAHERGLNDKLFNEIESIYYAIPADYTRPKTMIYDRLRVYNGISAPRVEPRHRDLRYLRAWEYCTLKYAGEDYRKDQHFLHVDNVLAQLADDRSLVVWEYLFEQAVRPNSGPYRLGFAVSERIWSYPSARGVQALVRIHDIAKKLPAVWADWRYFETPADFMVYRFGEQPITVRQQWEAAIGSSNQAGVADDAKALLRRLADFQPPGPQPNYSLGQKRIDEDAERRGYPRR